MRIDDRGRWEGNDGREGMAMEGMGGEEATDEGRGEEMGGREEGSEGGKKDGREGRGLGWLRLSVGTGLAEAWCRDWAGCGVGGGEGGGGRGGVILVGKS